MAEPRTFTYDETFAAMCIMEEIADSNLPDAGSPWLEYRDEHGINQLREAVIEKLAGPCDKAWTRARDAYDDAYNAWVSKHADDPAKGACPVDVGSFDYDFVPTWLRTAVDWSDAMAGPRVRGSSNG